MSLALYCDTVYQINWYVISTKATHTLFGGCHKCIKVPYILTYLGPWLIVWHHIPIKFIHNFHKSDSHKIILEGVTKVLKSHL